jgi:carbonic anhydrase/acetyltransferase-like protein (isoleucine patch superfamily)
MIKPFNGKTPKVAESAWVAESACVIGDVEIGEDCCIFPGVVIRGDFTSIKIGNNSDIEDNSVLHVKSSIEIGENVVIGHNVVVHCRKIGNNTIIGNNATVLEGAEVGERCVIAAGAVVTPNSVIPEESFVTGVPAKVKGKVNAGQADLVAEHYRWYTREYKQLFKVWNI